MGAVPFQTTTRRSDEELSSWPMGMSGKDFLDCVNWHGKIESTVGGIIPRIYVLYCIRMEEVPGNGGTHL